jgi:peptidoglycan/LPS O-acetylase OafA/YrhL
MNVSTQSTIKSSYIPSLDGVRGSAFFLVLLAHFSNQYNGPFKGVGKVGVWLFFVLSAFLLTKYFLESPRKITSAWEWGNYALRRFFRIVPLFVGVLFLYYLFGYIIKNENIIDHILFLRADGHFWTIIVEVKYYFILPITTLLLHFISNLSIWKVLIVNGIILNLVTILFPADSYPISDTGAFTYLSVFLVGSISALIYLKYKEKYSHRLHKILSLLGVAGLLTIVVTIPRIWSSLLYEVNTTYFYKDYIFLSIPCAVIVVSSCFESTLTSKLFSLKPFKLLGLISYSGYLIHPLVLSKAAFLQNKVGTFFSILLSLLLIFVASTALYYFVERPLSKIKLSSFFLLRFRNRPRITQTS